MIDYFSLKMTAAKSGPVKTAPRLLAPATMDANQGLKTFFGRNLGSQPASP
jgi:hypothetical protein